jgi:hypothetical protein
MKNPICPERPVVGLVKFVVLFASTVALCAVSAQAETHSFRYSLSTKSGEPKYSDELPAGKGETGCRYDVEVDVQGRTTQVATIQDGQKISKVVYHFPKNEKLPDGYDNFEAGERTGTVQIQRNENGYRKRVDYKTTQGTLTGYTLYFYHPDNVEAFNYSPEGVEKERDTLFYSDRGLLVRYRYYLNGNSGSSFEYEVDENTGFNKSGKQFEGTRILNTKKFTYDADGNLTRRDGYGSTGDWYVAVEFSKGLATKKIYKGNNGQAGKEIQYSYDKKRWGTECKIYYNNRLICTLIYDRLPDGTVKRTLAKGPNGDLWAEYPNAGVMDIDSTGQAVGQTNAIIYKTGAWW